MRYASVLLVACCLLSVVKAQWLETTIQLPDTFGWFATPQCLAYNSTNNVIYVGSQYAGSGYGGVHAIDGASNRLVARIPTESGVRALCYNPTDNRIYGAIYSCDSVTVIDGATNGVIATVAAGTSPSALCYNPQNDKVYCANDGSDDVAVIDGATNEVMATVNVGVGRLTGPSSCASAKTGRGT